MINRKIIISVLLVLFTATFAFCQSEMLKPVVNSLAFYKKTKDLKFLGLAKKSMDSLITTHSDSLDLQKSVYRSIVNSSILYSDSLNTLKQSPVLFDQTVQLIDKISGWKKIGRYSAEMAYVNNCIANTYIRKGFGFMGTSDFVNAAQSFIKARKYAPDFKRIDFYIAYSNNKLGNIQDAAKYYNNLIHKGNPKAEYIQTAASLYNSIGDTAKALEIIQEGRKIYPTDRVLMADEANIYNNKKDYGSLERLLDPLLEAHPNNADIAFVAANCYDRLNRYEKAESLYSRAIELNSSAYDPVFNLGLLYFREGVLKDGAGKAKDLIMAAQMLEKANEISPNDIKGLQALQLVYTQTQNKNQLNKVNSKLKQLTNQ